MGSADSWGNSVARPSQEALHSDCVWACWALLPSRGQRGALEPLGDFWRVWCTRFLSPRHHSTTKIAHPRPPEVRGSRLQRRRSAATNLPNTTLSLVSAQGQGPREQQECGRQTRGREAQKFRGAGPETPSPAGILLRGTLSQSQVRGVLDRRGAVRGQGRRAHLPGSPEVPRLQRDLCRVFSILFLPAVGRVSEDTCKPPHLTAPRPALRSYKRALSKCRHQINTQEATALSTPSCALYASLSVTALFPLASRIFFPSSLLFLFFF